MKHLLHYKMPSYHNWRGGMEGGSVTAIEWVEASVLLNILQCTGQPPPATKTHSGQDVLRAAEAEKPCLAPVRGAT